MNSIPTPRFSLRTLLIVVTIVAAWSGTFAIGEIGTDLRRVLQMSILIVAAGSALHYRGKTQAFWLGFLFVFVLVACQKLGELVEPLMPQIRWARTIARYYAISPQGQRSDMYYPIYDTLWLASVLLLSGVGGCISLTIYNRARRHSD